MIGAAGKPADMSSSRHARACRNCIAVSGTGRYIPSVLLSPGAPLLWRGIPRALVMAGVLCRLLRATPVAAQELEPKAYSAVPIGGNFLVTAGSWSKGGVLFDPTLPVKDVDATVGSMVVGVGHSFGLFNRLTRVQATFPFAFADFSGTLRGEQTTRSRTGFADSRYEISMNVWGTRALLPRAFAAAPRRTTVGWRLAAVAPTGQYDGTRVLNIGANRWAFRPEVGVSWPHGHWDMDGYIGTWLFTKNADFAPGGLLRTQDNVLTVQGHLVYTFQSRMWVTLDGTYYRGGAATVEDGAPGTSLSNSRIGSTLSVPFGSRYSAKFSYSSGLAVQTGTNFKTVTAVWQVLWLSPRFAGR